MSATWILGATGRTARGITRELDATGAELVLAGRDRDRLQAAADGLKRPPRLVVGTLESVLAGLAHERPAVVVNAIGPFTTTAAQVARACPPGTHYLDVANEIPALQAVLALGDHAEERGSTLVTAAGFGVLATEAAARRLLEERAAPASVRVDVLPSVALESGSVGPALAGTIVGAMAVGGQAVRGGRLVPARAGEEPEMLTTPDGEPLTTAGASTGDLLAAWRATQAPTVLAASTMAPTGAAARFAGLAGGLLRLPGAVTLGTRLIARVPFKAAERPRASSWARARLTWADGSSRTAWLGTDDAMEFTARAAAKVARRLTAGDGRPGAHTPGGLFGWQLAEAAGARLEVEEPHATSARSSGTG